ncbi:hypothetical protein EVAR_49842_1 [Eumeta japonica]|uniref:Uncharacterized protein n=1 Tax=Eumeta variegata TaxID=151549 RepID=A0A4C1YWN9_EUMVA|nr:hypothetical protein EVAR_49842_1 [Eumeta japonica]
MHTYAPRKDRISSGSDKRAIATDVRVVRSTRPPAAARRAVPVMVLAHSDRRCRGDVLPPAVSRRTKSRPLFLKEFQQDSPLTHPTRDEANSAA